VADAKLSAISRALEENGGNRTRAAKQLGLSRQSLLYEMKVLGLKP
jgi:transcriptional regulator with PAS, ATPase and Fis domain